MFPHNQAIKRALSQSLAHQTFFHSKHYNHNTVSIPYVPERLFHSLKIPSHYFNLSTQCPSDGRQPRAAQVKVTVPQTYAVTSSTSTSRAVPPPPRPRPPPRRSDWILSPSWIPRILSSGTRTGISRLGIRPWAPLMSRRTAMEMRMRMRVCTTATLEE